MSCRRAYELDLAAFLLDPRDERWDDFRAHYPGCADCAAEVAAWSALETLLGPGHPDEETLLRWARERDELDATTRAAVQRHLARCPSCSEELRLLERFAAIRASAARASDGAEATSSASSERRGEEHPEAQRHEAAARPASRRVDHAATRAATATSHVPAAPARARRGLLRRVLWHPALPYAALLAVLLLPSFRDRFEQAAGPPSPQLGVGDEPVLRKERTPPPHAPAARAPKVPAPEAASRSRALGELETGSADSEAAGGVAQSRDEPVPLADGASAPLVRAVPPAEGDVASVRSARRREERTRRATTATAGSSAMRLTAPTGGGGRTLVIDLPEAARGAASLEVRVRDETGAREMRERVRPPARTASLALEVPAAWLASRTLAVEVVAPDGSVVASGVVAMP